MAPFSGAGSQTFPSKRRRRWTECTYRKKMKRKRMGGREVGKVGMFGYESRASRKKGEKCRRLGAAGVAEDGIAHARAELMVLFVHKCPRVGLAGIHRNLNSTSLRFRRCDKKCHERRVGRERGSSGRLSGFSCWKISGIVDEGR